MSILRTLWNDQRGYILSAEAVLLGTVGILGATVGLSTLSTAVNEELTEVAFAIRSVDQSYGFQGQSSCRAWSAGSSYQQKDVQQALQDLCANASPDDQQREQHLDRELRERIAPQRDSDRTPSRPQRPSRFRDDNDRSNDRNNDRDNSRDRSDRDRNDRNRDLRDRDNDATASLN